jgi:hypothetical protein
MAHPKNRGMKNPRQTLRAVAAGVAETEAQEAEEAEKAKGNVSVPFIVMNSAPLQMTNIWPPLQTQAPHHI